MAGDFIQGSFGLLALYQMAPADFLSAGIGGSTCSDATARYATNEATFFRTRRAVNVAVLVCGRNNLGQGNTPAATFAQIEAYVAAAQSTGYTVVVQTVMSSFNVNNTDRATLNTLIRDNAVADGYTVMDVAADPDLGCDLCWQNTTYFLSDGVHLTYTGGMPIQAGYLKTTLESFGFLSL